MSNMTWSKYLNATSNGDYNSAIAEKVGVDPATVGRWRSGTVDPKPRQVVAYARAYALNPLAALVASGYLAESDIEGGVTVDMPTDLRGFSSMALLSELNDRLSVTAVYTDWLRALASGDSSMRPLSASALESIDPTTAPREADANPFLDVIGDRLSVMPEIKGETLHVVKAADVPASRHDVALAAYDDEDWQARQEAENE